MPSLVLGPLLRHVDDCSATVWVETDRPCAVRILEHEAPTFTVAGHHYALVAIEGLAPDTVTPYEVHMVTDGEAVQVWPESGSTYPASRIRTLAPQRPVRLVFGSCRWARPDTAGPDRQLPPDALDTYARDVAERPDAEWPDALLLLGDQVYADETTPLTQVYLANRRDLAEPPYTEVADFEEYTHLYLESWTDPEVRWLLSTVPSAMIFDDHDVRDDWNTSAQWRREMQATEWWQSRIEGALMSYWIYQHLGNLAPADLAQDETWRRVRELAARGEDAEAVLREFAAAADAEADGEPATRWSYRRDFGRTRLLMIDSRAGRVLTGERGMVGPAEFDWMREQSRGEVDHLLLGSSLPWLMAHSLHDVEAWNEHMCTRLGDTRRGRIAEKMRQGADMEHWSSFLASFQKLGRLIAEVAARPDAPATICVLSGDVHHAYVARATFPGREVASRVYQVTCSPVHNEVPPYMRVGFRVGWSAAARQITSRWNRLFKVESPEVTWAKELGPFFDNQLGTLTLHGRTAEFGLDRTEGTPEGSRLVHSAGMALHDGR
ncbi:MAG: alkaline phosphatase family protein [Geodermatophilaceae bacterium]|nr:alkaline phosphatase family protein [Geodermatophilaceae bacterium]